LHTLMDVLENPAPFANEIARYSATDVGAGRFFKNDFQGKGFSETRQQITTRLHEILSQPELRAMLGADENNVSMMECLDEGKIVLVNTAMNHLDVKGSSLLGRFFIAQTLAAAFARKKRNPAVLMIDEFQDFADEDQTPRMLRLAGE